MGIFQKLNERGITIVMVTHELDIAAYAKRNLVMRDGDRADAISRSTQASHRGRAKRRNWPPAP